MSPEAKTQVVLVAALSILALNMSEARAQGVPEGACEIPGGHWCWPAEPTRYGQPCQCVTESGATVQGVTR